MSEQRERGENLADNYSYRELDMQNPDNVEEVVNLKFNVAQADRVMLPSVDNPAFNIGSFDGDVLNGDIEVDKDGHINYLVHPEYRGQGIATKLLDKATRAAEANDISQLVATVESGSASEGLLQKSDFVLTGEVEDDTQQKKLIYTKKL